jgi:hypothetical protein
MRARGIVSLILVLAALAGVAWAGQAIEAPGPQEDAVGRTPPRLSFVDGQVSFWRPGAQEWTQAQINTPLAPGDQVYTGSPGNLELQIGGRAFVRGWANTNLGLESHESDFLQFKVTTGRAAFDLRTLEPGRTVEVDTPNAAFTIEHPGYYRVDVIGERTSFITRRAGRATVIPAGGESATIAPSEEVVVEGVTSPKVSSYVAPQLDEWDKWNYARTDVLLDAVSARHVPPGTYGVADLDRHGDWRVVDDYGSVWVPTGVPRGWAPYTTGAWTLDPYYGWTWVDTAPWGWAPYHYGRWVSVRGFWGWAPGPVVARPVYAPALVAFLGGPSVSVSVGFGGPVVGWVALGWGEPCVPWWGRPGFAHRPWWGGWGGPRVVNNVVVHHTTVVNVQNINVYRNTSVKNAVVVVNENRFGRGRITPARVTEVDVHSLKPIHTAPQVATTPASFVPTARRGIRPPEENLRQSVVSTRPPHRGAESASGGERKAEPAGPAAPAPRVVSAPPRGEPGSAMPRPPFGQGTVERPTAERTQPPAPPRRDVSRRADKASEGAQAVTGQVPPQPQVTGPAPKGSAAPADRALPPAPSQKPEGPRAPERGAERPQSAARQAVPQAPRELQGTSAPPVSAAPSGRRGGPPEAGRPAAAGPQAARTLPGEPANQLSPGRAASKPSEPKPRQSPPAQDRQKGGPEKGQGERKGG